MARAQDVFAHWFLPVEDDYIRGHRRAVMDFTTSNPSVPTPVTKPTWPETQTAQHEPPQRRDWQAILRPESIKPNPENVRRLLADASANRHSKPAASPIDGAAKPQPIRATRRDLLALFDNMDRLGDQLRNRP